MSEAKSSSIGSGTVLAVLLIFGGVTAGVLMSSYAVLFGFAGAGVLYIIYLACTEEAPYEDDDEPVRGTVVERQRPEPVERAPEPAARAPAPPEPRVRREPDPPQALPIERDEPSAPKPTKRRRRRLRFWRKRRRPTEHERVGRGEVPKRRSWRWRRKNIFREDELN